MLSDDTGAVALDFVGRYESLQADFDASATASIYPEQRLLTATAPSTTPTKTCWMTS